MSSLIYIISGSSIAIIGIIIIFTMLFYKNTLFFPAKYVKLSGCSELTPNGQDQYFCKDVTTEYIESGAVVTAPGFFTGDPQKRVGTETLTETTVHMKFKNWQWIVASLFTFIGFSILGYGIVMYFMKL